MVVEATMRAKQNLGKPRGLPTAIVEAVIYAKDYLQVVHPPTTRIYGSRTHFPFDTGGH